MARYLIILFAPKAASWEYYAFDVRGHGVVALVTSTYNFMKQRNNYKKDVQVWKENYENYIHRIIKRIKEWQKVDINI